MNNPADRLPPFSPEAEAGYLGCVLLEPDNGKTLLSKLRKSYFYDQRHRAVFAALSALVSEGKSPDLPGLYQWLKDRERLADAGGQDYVMRLPDQALSAANIPTHFATLKDKAARRELVRLATQAIQMAEDGQLDATALVSEFARLSTMIAASAGEPREWVRFYTPSQCRGWNPPEGLVLVGDCHIVRGSTTVIGGPPGVGKSRAGHALALSGATLVPWFGLPVHRRFRTAILQNENGLHRLKSDFSEIRAEGLDDFIRVSEPPPFGMAFDRSEFRLALADWLADFQPDVVIFDPWNSAARDDTQRDYLETFQALRDVLPKGETAPALVIVAHTRKPKNDERKSGRGLLNLLAGSHVLGSVPRCAFVMQAASDDPEDDRVVWTCCKNNDGDHGHRSAWHRRDGLFVPCDDFDWSEFDAPEGEGRRTITEGDMVRLFQNGGRRLELKQAVRELETLTDFKTAACYNALKRNGRFAAHLYEDGDGLLGWRP